jgi:hypothetical protein
MIQAIFSKSTNPKKKYKVIVTDGERKKTIHFGQAGAEDFTIHKDEERKNRYIDRHKSRENFQDPFTAGFWALHSLWNKKSINSSLKDIKDKFNIKIKKSNS